MSRMVGGIGGACREGYGSSLGDDPLRQVATVLESCPDNRDSGQEWTSGKHRRVRDRRANKTKNSGMPCVPASRIEY